jgi:2-phospho-L-lactate guanylyltransferase (CobY/MobA/RfbA family)
LIAIESDPAGGFGESYPRAVRAALAAGYEQLLVVGDDIPDLVPRDLAAAFTALERADVALGASRDGGYYLIGLKTWRPELFMEVPWQTAGVFQTTLQRAAAAGLRVACLEVRHDLDDAAQVDLFVGEILGSPALARAGAWLLNLIVPRGRLLKALWFTIVRPAWRALDPRYALRWQKAPPEPA